ncbi:hypothetical protein CcNV_013 [Crangon crangon nudivirus]|uniref:Uncharacterized protein n=1 Tax=Crangon crangon nudivirus TaxID=2880838 RepID=A0AAE9BYZ6_9VIRU|nr:hypothetical protein QKT25_gp013 [Crangon crangon nudivirus]UBZ25497.1 hypothetical protein CcNV_013 [Crangon crangon nudivirus]
MNYHSLTFDIAMAAQVKFNPYLCDCSTNPDEIPLVITNKTILACICRNYLIYAESRNMLKYLHKEHISLLKQSDHYTIKKIKIIPRGTTYKNRKSQLYNETLSLLLYGPEVHSEIAQALEPIIMSEFLTFLKRHIDVDEIHENVAAAKLFDSTMSKVKYNF